jgi:hypothetical protein
MTEECFIIKYADLAKEYGCKLSDNHTKVIDRVVKRDGYCPCVVEENADTICPCLKFRTEGYCCCKLFIKE